MTITGHARIFISYSHRGNGPAWKAALLRALQVFEQHHLLDVWQDGKIRVSAFWDDDIKRAMAEAQLAVVLLTKEALASEYILAEEFPVLRERQQHEKLPVFPVICEECDWRAHDWLRATQAPNNSEPLSGLKPEAQERVFRELATAIAEELSRVALQSLSSPGEPPGDGRIYLDKFPLTHSTGLREEKLIGREQELALLDLAFAQPHTAIVSLVAWGGVGKTMLVKHWLQRLQRQGWFGAGRVYAWSFYSQGTKEDRQASEDSFLAYALEWFGVQCEPTLSPWDKGRLLADAVARERTLLILDGIEPLQYPPGPMGGQLRAPGVQSLLKQLARKATAERSAIENPQSAIGCLCLVTTREPLTDLADFQRRKGIPWGSVLRVDLGNLTEEAGAALLHHAGAKRAGAAEVKPDDAELLAASREVDGHALTLNLLGRFLARAHGGDIRRRDLVKFEEADRQVQGGTTFKMLAAFENWFAKSGEFGERQLAILRILGLFDRPADSGCIAALRNPPVIAGLTDPLFHSKGGVLGWRKELRPLPEEDWNTATSFLADFGLVEEQLGEIERFVGFDEEAATAQHLNVFYRDNRTFLRWIIYLVIFARAVVGRKSNLGEPKAFENRKCQIVSSNSLDTHPLIREFFAERLRVTDAAAWKAAHSRLFDCLKVRVPYWPEGLDGLQPLYHAVTHGSCADVKQKAFSVLFQRRICRRNQNYAIQRLGAINATLEALSCFYDRPWSTVSPTLSDADKSLLYNQVAFCLNALGRTTEALDPVKASLASYLKRIGRGKVRLATLVASLIAPSSKWNRWGNAVNAARVANNLCEMELILGEVMAAVSDAEQAVALADWAYQGLDIFVRQITRTTLADAMNQAGRFSDSRESFLQAEALQAKDQPKYPLLYGPSGFQQCDLYLVESETAAWQMVLNLTSDIRDSKVEETCLEIQQWAKKTLEWSGIAYDASILCPALDGLTIARIGLYQLIFARSDPNLQNAGLHPMLTTVVDELRRSGHANHIPRGLLTRAWLRVLEGDLTCARADLDEAWDIAERGPMRLHLADIHLHRARLFFREKPYPWKSPQDDLAGAEKLINDCGYHRRDEELADAKRAILGEGK